MDRGLDKSQSRVKVQEPINLLSIFLVPDYVYIWCLTDNKKIVSIICVKSSKKTTSILAYTNVTIPYKNSEFIVQAN